MGERGNGRIVVHSPTRPFAHSFHPRRLEAEVIRDAILAVAGTMDTKMLGEPVPVTARPTGEVVPVGDNNGGRRSIYQLVRRSQPQSLLNAFDAPVMETNCTRRASTTTVTQTLAVLNSEFVTAQALHFARRVLLEQPPAAGNHAATVEHAFRLALARKPTNPERIVAAEFVREQMVRHAKASDPMAQAYADLCQALLSANEFVYID